MRASDNVRRKDKETMSHKDLLACKTREDKIINRVAAKIYNGATNEEVEGLYPFDPTLVLMGIERGQRWIDEDRHNPQSISGERW